MRGRQNPRLLTPAVTISIGGVQTGGAMPGRRERWHLLGQTAVRTYQCMQPDLPAEPGDAIKFAPVAPRRLRAGPRCRSRRDRGPELMSVMSKLVIASIGPASSVAGRRPPRFQRYGLVPSGAMGSPGARRRIRWSGTSCSRPVSKSSFGAVFTRAARCASRLQARRRNAALDASAEIRDRKPQRQVDRHPTMFFRGVSISDRRWRRRHCATRLQARCARARAR